METKKWVNEINKEIEPLIQSDYEEFKNYSRFAFVREVLATDFKDLNDNQGTFLDLGCSKGEFFYYLLSYYKNIEFTGVDLSNELISIGKQEPSLRSINFVCQNVLKYKSSRQFDFVYASGLLSIFDESQDVLNKMLELLKPGHKGAIFGIFNQHNFDVSIRFRNYMREDDESWQSGLATFSLQKLEESLGDRVSHFKSHPFKIPLDIAPDPSNPIRSFTQKLDNGERIITNGLNLIQNFFLIEFIKS